MTAHNLHGHTRMHVHIFNVQICMHMCTCTFAYTGEYGIVYKAQLVRGGLPQLVAVKTVKGKVCFMHCTI